MRSKQCILKRSFSILSLILCGSLFFNCILNLPPDVTDSINIIDSLVLVEKSCYTNGDTLHLKAITDNNEGEIVFSWNSNAGTIIENDSCALFIPDIESQVTIKCYAECNDQIDSISKDLKLYGDYFPIKSGNIWVFDANYEFPDDVFFSNIKGLETWEILDVNTQRDTIIMKLTFEGMSYTHWHSSGTTDSSVTTEHRTIKLCNDYVYNSRKWSYCESISGSSNTYRVPMGFNLFLEWGIEQSIDNNIDTLKHGSFETLVKGIGPLKEVFGGADYTNTLNLISCTIYGTHHEIGL